MRVLGLIVGCAATAAAANTTAVKQVTFNRDVLPVLQKNCQSCHRPGEVAPMSFTTYDETRPWAKAIKAAVLTKKMPPWLADPRFGHFANERRLTNSEVSTLVNWADGGAAEGSPKDAPAPPHFLEGWNIKPDVVFEMPQPFDVPASGTMEYQYIIIPTNFTKDTWVTAAEVRPGNRAVVHHVIAFIRPPGSQWMKDAKPGVPFVPVTHERDANGAAIRRNVQTPSGDPQQQQRNATVLATENLAGYAPGLQPQRYDIVPGAAKLVPAGSDIVFQLHYTTNGKAATDRTKVGITLATEAPKYRYVTMSAGQQKLEIPPNDANYESHSQVRFKEPVQLVWLMPHMHLRGKDFIYEAVFPTGEKQTLLSVPRYDFNWQLGYDEAQPVLMPKGSRLECTAHHDNSVNNPANPNPNVTVRWGDQSWEEMMIGWFGVIVDANVKPEDLVERPARKAAGSD